MSQVKVLGQTYKIYDDTNYRELVRAANSDGRRFGGGYDAQAAGPFASAAPAERFTNVPRSEWKERIEEREAKGMFPSHWFKRGGVKVLNQRSWGYCWGYGVVGAMQTAYAMTGRKAPHLNAFPTCYRIKNGRNVGGWAGEMIKGIDSMGVPTMDAFPDQSTRQSDFQSQKYLTSAAKHKVVKFTELPRKNFSALVSHFLGPKPSPVTLGLMWWGHLIYAVAPVVTGANSVGIMIINSWDYSWGNQGAGVLAEGRATADEQFAVHAVRPY